MDKTPSKVQTASTSHHGNRNHQRIHAKVRVEEAQKGMKLFDFLAEVIHPPVSKTLWKKCIEAGGVWQRLGKQKKRIKRVTTLINTGDHFEVYFDSNTLEITKNSDPSVLLYHQQQISCWLKPHNMLTQDSPYGDQSSLFHYVSQKIHPTYLVHRLDRETEGLVLFAHSKEMAALCNTVFSEHLIQKYYYALIVKKNPITAREIDEAIEGKKAITRLEIPDAAELEKLYNQFPETQTFDATWVKLLPLTGRKHQLRIHMQRLGRPLLHDPRYSRTHKKGQRLYLIAYALYSERLHIDIDIFKL